MKVAIDVSYLNIQSQTRGIGVYVGKLLEHIPHVDTKSADIIHFPYFDLFFFSLPFHKTAKWVVTIHDVIPLIYPEHFSSGIRGRVKFFIQRLNLLRADAIITDSKNSKNDIIKHLKIPASKIHVIYLGVDPIFRPLETSKKSNILYIGDVNYNKNLPILLEAFASLKNPELELVLAGQAWKKSIPETNNLRHKISELRIENSVRIVSPQSVKAIVKLYNQAQVYVQPSLYEGFGLPVLEAMACGTLVVSSNTSSLPELCGAAAILVKPTATDLATGIRQALTLSSKQHKSYIGAGITQASKFTWSKTAAETMEVYNKILAV